MDLYDTPLQVYGPPMHFTLFSIIVYLRILYLRILVVHSSPDNCDEATSPGC